MTELLWLDMVRKSPQLTSVKLLRLDMFIYICVCVCTHVCASVHVCGYVGVGVFVCTYLCAIVVVLEPDIL